MEFMVAGLMLWSVVHLFPVLAPGLRQFLIGRMGEKGYKGFFALLIVLSVVLIVYGWRHAIPTHAYLLPPAFKHVAMFLIVVAFILMGAAQYPTRIKRGHYWRSFSSTAAKVHGLSLSHRPGEGNSGGQPSA